MFNVMPAVRSAGQSTGTHILSSDLADYEWIPNIATGFTTIPESNAGVPMYWDDWFDVDVNGVTVDGGPEWDPSRKVWRPRDFSEGLECRDDNNIGVVTQVKAVACRVVVKLPTAGTASTEYLLQKFNDGTSTSTPLSYAWDGWILYRTSDGIQLAAREGPSFTLTNILVTSLGSGDADYHQVSMYIGYDGSTGFDMKLRVDQLVESTGFRAGSTIEAYRFPLLANRRHINSNFGVVDADYAYLGVAEGAGALAFYNEDAPLPRLDP